MKTGKHEFQGNKETLKYKKKNGRNKKRKNQNEKYEEKKKRRKENKILTLLSPEDGTKNNERID